MFPDGELALVYVCARLRYVATKGMIYTRYFSVVVFVYASFEGSVRQDSLSRNSFMLL